EGAIPHLIESLYDQDTVVRIVALGALQDLGEPAVGPLCEFARNTDNDFLRRSLVIWVLSDMIQPDYSQWAKVEISWTLKEAAKDDHPIVKETAEEALGRVRSILEGRTESREDATHGPRSPGDPQALIEKIRDILEDNRGDMIARMITESFTREEWEKLSAEEQKYFTVSAGIQFQRMVDEMTMTPKDKEDERKVRESLGRRFRRSMQRGKLSIFEETLFGKTMATDVHDLLTSGANVSCGTICEKEHEGTFKALDSQLERQFEEYREAIGIEEERDLTERESDKALVKLGHATSMGFLRKLRGKIRKEAGVPDKIKIFFGVPENGTELYWVDNKWGAGHFNRDGNRIHISLPFIKNSGVDAGVAVAEHELAHIQKGVHEKISKELQGFFSFARREDTIRKRRPALLKTERHLTHTPSLGDLDEEDQARLAKSFGIGDGKTSLSEKGKKRLSKHVRVAGDEDVFDIVKAERGEAWRKKKGIGRFVSETFIEMYRVLSGIVRTIVRKKHVIRRVTHRSGKDSKRIRAPEDSDKFEDSDEDTDGSSPPSFLNLLVLVITAFIVILFMPFKSAQAQTQEPIAGTNIVIGTEIDGSRYSDYIFGTDRYPSSRNETDGTRRAYFYDPTWDLTDEYTYHPDGTMERTDHSGGGSPEILVPGWQEFFRGANLPWGNYGFDLGLGANGESHEGFSTPAKRAALYQELSRWKGGYVRVFLFCDLRSGMNFDLDGTPLDFTSHVYADMDALVEAADMLGIKLIPVIFDYMLADGVSDEGGYPVGEHPDLITDSTKRAAFLSIMTDFIRTYANNDAIVAWDVMNEPSICPEKTGITIAQMEAFLADFVDMIRAEDPNTKVTVGAKNMGTAANWTGLNLHFYSVHYYDYMSGDYPLEDPVSMDKPVIYTELEPTNIPYKMMTVYDSGAEGALFWQDSWYAIPDPLEIHTWNESVVVPPPPPPDSGSSGGGCTPDAGMPQPSLMFPFAALAAAAFLKARSASRTLPKGQTAGTDAQEHKGEEESDFAISSEGAEDFTREGHEDFHREGKFAEVIESIAQELISKRISLKKRHDGRWDFKKALDKKWGKRIETSCGELRIDEVSKALVIIDDRFEKDHVGRNEYAVYARNEAKAAHELAELHLWIHFAVQLGIIDRIDIQRN
ncbi:MAG: cellulase family glycosylhydrolase, partial [Candidatus Omnitrophota bacterium]